MIKVKVKIQGTDALVKKIKKLPTKLAKKVMGKVMRAGASVVLKKARASVPQDSGTLKKSLAVRITVKKSTGVMYAIVGPKTKFIQQHRGQRRWASKYAHLTEFGRQSFTRVHRKTGVRQSIGALPGSRWLTRAAQASRATAMAKMVQKAAKELAKEAGRA